MRVLKYVVCGALLMAPAFGFAHDNNPQKDVQSANGMRVQPQDQVKVKNGKVNPQKSPLTVQERKFVEQAASDNMAEIELSRLALDKSQNSEVKNLAQTVVDDHQKSLDKLKSIANDQKFPIPTSATTQAKQEYQKLSKLSGNDFDRQYLMLMQKDHKRAVQTFQQASNQLQNDDLKSYADQTLPTLQQHAQMAKSDMDALKNK